MNMKALLGILLAATMIQGMYLPLVLAQGELKYTVTDTDVIVRGAGFEVYISLRGGIEKYVMDDTEVLKDTAVYMWGPHWRGAGFTTQIGDVIKSPDIKPIEGGLRIITYARWNRPQYNQFFDVVTVHEVYESGVVYVIQNITAYKDSQYELAVVMASLLCSVYAGRNATLYRGGSKIATVYLKTEPAKPATRILFSGAFDILQISAPGGAASLLFVVLNPPVVGGWIQDYRAWGADYYAVMPTVEGFSYKKSMSKGETATVKFLVFPHKKGAEFNAKAIEALSKQVSTYKYVAQVKSFAKSKRALSYVEKAEKLLPSVLSYICKGDVDGALNVVNEAYSYARKAYNTELMRTSTLLIIIPAVISLIIIARYGIRALRRS